MEQVLLLTIEDVEGAVTSAPAASASSFVIMNINLCQIILIVLDMNYYSYLWTAGLFQNIVYKQLLTETKSCYNLRVEDSEGLLPE